jgi:hypothetical protein
MNIKQRLSKIEDSLNPNSKFCECPVVTFVVGTDKADFFSKHPECGKPIDLTRPCISEVIEPKLPETEENYQ